jgi:hypothetical protein
MDDTERTTNPCVAEDGPRTPLAQKTSRGRRTRRAQTGVLRADGIPRVMTRNAALHVVRCARGEDERGEWQ